MIWFYWVPPDTVEGIKKELEEREKELDTAEKEVRRQKTCIQELEEALKELQPNFYLNKVYTRDGFPGEYYCLQISQVDKYCELYNITKLRKFDASINPTHILEDMYDRKGKYITHSCMNILTGGQVDDFKPLNDE